MNTTPATGDTADQTTTHTFHMDPSQSLSEAVLEAVATRSGYSLEDAVTELEPLYDTIDPEALDALFCSSVSTTRDAGTVSFLYEGYDVTIDASGEIMIEPA